MSQANGRFGRGSKLTSITGLSTTDREDALPPQVRKREIHTASAINTPTPSD